MKKHGFGIVLDGPSPKDQESVAVLLQEAFRAHQSGNLNLAAEGYQSVLKLDSQQPDALHLLGVIAHQLGNSASGIELMQASLAANQNNADVWGNLGNAYLAVGNGAEAERAYRRAVIIDGNHCVSHYNLANLLVRNGSAASAIEHFRRAVLGRPQYIEAHWNLGSALFSLERYSEALECYLRVQELNPEWPQLLTNLGPTYAKLGDWDRAAEVLEAALARNPSDALALSNLGVVFLRQEEPERAADCFRKAATIQPENAEIQFGLAESLSCIDLAQALVEAEALVEKPNVRVQDWVLFGTILTGMGRYEQAISAFEVAKKMDKKSLHKNNHYSIALSRLGRVDEAIESFRETIRLNPQDTLAYAELGLAIKDTGDVPGGLEVMRQGLAIEPNAGYHSNVLFTLYYDENLTPQDILQESKAWAAQYTPTVPPAPALIPKSSGKIRIGYLSADFLSHPAGYLYDALFPLHDKSKFEIYLYVNQLYGDSVTARIVESADKWLMVKYLDDDELAQRVREDEIDVFVDLLGHTNNHRLQVFGKRPAPVQVGWLGYFGTTGMDQMDYIVCDSITLPPCEEVNYTEAPARMPNCMYVFQPPKVEIKPAFPPALKNGFVTFGCFNNTAKITPSVVELWSEVLHRIPNSKLLLNRWPFQTELVRNRYRELFLAQGIKSDRLEFRATKTRAEYFAGYNEVDIMLDTFPFGGGTTTSEALWMGVPVVTLPSNRLVGHMTESIYSAVGLTGLEVHSPQEFVELACKLAQDPERLRGYRNGLRKKVEDSPLCDLPQFAKDLEGLYEWMTRQAAVRTAA